MTREQWHELIDYQEDPDREAKIVEQWENRFSTVSPKARSLSDGTLEMPNTLPPAPEADPDHHHAFGSWARTENKRNAGNRKPDTGCIEGKIEHHYIGSGSNRQGNKKRRCKNCGRTEIIEPKRLDGDVDNCISTGA